MTSKISTKPRFSTILVSRGNDNRPSDLEFGLRPHCQRIIVKRSPLSGAHLLMASERIAIRVYYPCDLQELIVEEEQKKQRAKQQTVTRLDKRLDKSDIIDDDFDDMSAFFSSFQVALVLFILSPIYSNNGKLDISIVQQLNDIRSHFHRAQRLSVQYQQEIKTMQSTDMTQRGTQNGAINSITTSTKKNCVLLLPDTESAIQNLIAVADSLAPERKARKRLLFQKLETKYFLPFHSLFNTNRDENTPFAVAQLSGQTNTKIQAATSAAVAIHVAEGLRKMARVFELPNGEMDILMSELGDLKTIATADDSKLATIPIDQRTRKVLHRFFGSSEGREENANNFRWGRLLPQHGLQRGQQHQYFDSRSFTTGAMQRFPQFTATSSSFSIPNSRCGWSPPSASASAARAIQRVQEFRQPQHYENRAAPNTVDEFWMESRKERAINSSLYHSGKDETIDTSAVFEFGTLHHPNKYPTALQMQEFKRSNWEGTDKQHWHKHFGCSRFPPACASSLSDFVTDNTIATFVTPGGQPSYDDVRLHQQRTPSFQRLDHHWVMRQSALSQQYTKSQNTNQVNQSIHLPYNIQSHEDPCFTLFPQHR